jgi:CxxC motif-containing protein (DUF1111 family)
LISDGIDSIKPEQLEMSVRIPLRHVGMGLMMAIDLDEIKQLASVSYPEFGISGKINWVEERNQKWIGLSGHKAQHADLTIELGFSSDFGITNDRFPHEVSEGQEQDPGNSGIQVSTRDMADVEFYMQSLGVPARRDVNSEIVKEARKTFTKQIATFVTHLHCTLRLNHRPCSMVRVYLGLAIKPFIRIRTTCYTIWGPS